jgi:hypothetical protein
MQKLADMGGSCYSKRHHNDVISHEAQRRCKDRPKFRYGTVCNILPLVMMAYRDYFKGLVFDGVRDKRHLWGAG